MADTILGIHSNVRPGMIDPATGQPQDPGLTDGHGWLSLTRDGKTIFYGLWPDDHPRVVRRGWSNGSGSDVRIGLEADMPPVASRYYRLTPAQATLLDAQLKASATWDVTDNCSSWASRVLEAVTGERINADEPYTAGVVETPRVLGASIHALERQHRTAREAPATPAPRKAQGSSVSGAGGVQAWDAAGPAGLSPRARQLLADSEREVRAVAQRHGLPWDPGLDNTVHAVAQQAHAQGLPAINLFHVKDGAIRFGHHDGYTVREGVVDARVAANTPETLSRERMLQTERAPASPEHLAVAPPVPVLQRV